MRKLMILAVVMTAFFSFPLMADTFEIPVNGKSHLALTNQSADQLNFHVQVGDLQAIEVETSEGTFTRLMLPGFHSSKVEGSPELPMLNKLIAVPFGAEVSVDVQVSAWREISLSDFGVRSPLMPAQPSMPKNVIPSEWPFVIDHSAYADDRAAVETVRVVEFNRLRAVDFARLEVSPVQYSPTRGTLRVAESMDVTVNFIGADHAAGQELMAKTNSPFFDHIYATFAGSRGMHDDNPDVVSDQVTMVIITPSQFEYTLADFVQWKTERGFKVVVGVIGTPEVGVTTSSIESYINGLYNDATPQLPAPSFVLFVGDVAQMPTFSEGGDATDRPYCAVDGDLVPDIYYGRFSATNVSQLQAIIDKTIMYDQFTMPDPSYLGNVTMIAGMDSGFGSSHGNGQINYGTTNYFNAAHGIYSNTYLYPNSGSNSSSIVQTVSDGVAYINYTAHGSQTSWADPSSTQSNINSLNNSGKYTMAVGNCCLTGTYDYNECFGETWLRAPDKGAIGYIGGSNNTMWDEDFWWGAGSCSSNSIGANTTYAQTGMGVYDGVFHDHDEDMAQWYVTNDALVFSGNLAVQEAGSGSTTYYWNIYNLLGDPSLSTYLGVPDVNPVTTSLGADALNVTAAAGSYIGLTQNGTLIGAGTADASGNATVNFDVTPVGGTPLHIVVTMQNYEPYIADIQLAAPEIVLDLSPLSASIQPEQTAVDYISIGNTGEAGSEVIYSVSWQSETPPMLAGLRNVSGSYVECVQTEYLPGETVDLNLSVFNNSDDSEWLKDVIIDFPAGITVNSSTAFSGGSGGDMDSDNATGAGATVSWHGEGSSGWGVIYDQETATATVNVTFTGSGTLVVDYQIDGDIYGSDPHSVSGDFQLEMSGPSLTMTSPNGGEVIAIDSALDITWNSAGGGASTVNLELSRNSGSSWTTIASSTNNDGSYNWTVTGPYSTECLVKVSSPDGTVTDTSDAIFTIFQPVDWLSVTPVSGSVGQGETDVLAVNYDSAGMENGTYVAYIIIDHNDGGPAVITVTMTVETGAPSGVDSPERFALTGNYPNPFNPSTEIAFSMSEDSAATLEIIDVRGSLIRAIALGDLTAGSHSISWNGRDDNGRNVASGTYFARLRAADNEVTHKMMLAK